MQKTVTAGYVLEVVGHLLWAYTVMIVVWGALTALVFFVFSGGKIDKTLETMVAFAYAPTYFISFAHIVIFTAFRFYFLPRFPDAPRVTTFFIATLAGSIVLATLWCFEAFKAASLGAIDTFPTWVAAHTPAVAVLFVAAIGGTLGAAAFGWVLEQMGGQHQLMYGFGRWLGRLIIGRERYDAFLAQEAARLHKAYEDYVAEIRREK